MDQTLVIGLGNPDPALERTYHNVGALAVAWIAEHRPERGARPEFRPYKNLFVSCTIEGVTLMRPLVYMNESGRAVKEALKVFSLGPADIVVIHDDSDLAIGSWKRTLKGRSGGHRGIQSIIEHLGTA